MLSQKLADITLQSGNTEDKIKKLESLKISLKKTLTDKDKKNAMLSQKLANVTTLFVNNDINKSIINKTISYLNENKDVSAIYHYNLARAYQDMKDYKNAIDNYNITLQINPDFKKAYYQLGLAYVDMKDYQSAAKMLKKYIQYPTSRHEYEIIQRFISNLEKAS